MSVDFMKNIHDLKDDEEYQNLPEGLKSHHGFNVMMGMMAPHKQE